MILAEHVLGKTKRLPTFIQDLTLPVSHKKRIVDALKKVNIVRVDQLLSMSYGQCLSIKNIGPQRADMLWKAVTEALEIL